MNTLLTPANVDLNHTSELMRTVGTILQQVGVPDWVESWTYSLDTDYYGEDVVRVKWTFRQFPGWLDEFVRCRSAYFREADLRLSAAGIERFTFVDPDVMESLSS
jgi:hypothetical protein